MLMPKMTDMLGWLTKILKQTSVSSSINNYKQASKKFKNSKNIEKK